MLLLAKRGQVSALARPGMVRGLYFGPSNDVGVQRRHSSIPSSVRRVSHEPIQSRPHWTEDLRRRSVWGLLQRHVCILAFFGYSGMSKGCNSVIGCDVRLTMKPMLVPKAIGSKIDTAGWANTSLGRVREGM